MASGDVSARRAASSHLQRRDLHYINIRNDRAVGASITRNGEQWRISWRRYQSGVAKAIIGDVTTNAWQGGVPEERKETAMAWAAACGLDAVLTLPGRSWRPSLQYVKTGRVTGWLPYNSVALGGHSVDDNISMWRSVMTPWLVDLAYR